MREDLEATYLWYHALEREGVPIVSTPSVDHLETQMTDNVTDKAIESIVQQWNGGEHVLAGKRASELVFGAGKKADQKLLDTLTEKAIGIERYIAPPDGPATTLVSDQSGDPLARQPENRVEDIHPSNVSSEQAKDEQDVIDARLAPGRNRREDPDSTRLNPTGSDEPVPAKKARKRA